MFQILCFVIVNSLLVSNVQSLDFRIAEVLFGPKRLYTNYEYRLNPYAGYRNRKTYAKEYGKNGSAFIKAVG